MVAGAHPGYRPWNAIDPVAQAPSTLVIATRVAGSGFDRRHQAELSPAAALAPVVHHHVAEPRLPPPARSGATGVVEDAARRGGELGEAGVGILAKG